MLRSIVLGVVATAAAAAEGFDAADATNRIGLEVFQRVRGEAKAPSVVVSPYSIESAMSLAYAGARGGTRAELGRALALPADDAAVRAGLAELRSSLDAAADAAKRAVQHAQDEGNSLETPQWRVANRLYGQDGYSFRPEFLALMRDGYQAPFVPVDFKHETERARVTINDWVAETTAQRIKNLVPAGLLTRDARLVLVNALYFKSPWADAFNPRLTEPSEFRLSDDQRLQVPTMHQKSHYRYGDNGQSQVVALPYEGGELQFVVVLPKAGVSLGQVVANLTPQIMRSWTTLKRPRDSVELWLPKLRLEPEPLELSSVFKKLGVHHAFNDPTGSADFDGIAPRTPEEYLYLSAIFHKTFVAVDEKGTEAAAATAVAMVAASAMRVEKPIEVRVDHPFLFAIQDCRSGVCLFLGEVDDPSRG